MGTGVENDRGGAWAAPDLGGRVAVVTGASRGVGRGVALVLCECGATVYATGRAPEAGAAQSITMWTGQVKHVPETLAETAELAAARGRERGGRCVAVQVDHTQDAQVEALFARLHTEQGRLDVLVNNVWGGYEDMRQFGRPFWEQPAWRWDAMFDAGARAHFVASRLAVPLMLPQGRGLIVNTSVAWPEERYDGRLVYYLAKLTVNRLAWAMAQELREHGLAAVALSPVGVRHAWVTSGDELRSIYQAVATPGRIDALYRAHPELLDGQTPEYNGRAVAMLAADEEVLERTGQMLRVSDLA
jgi:NAD(P)-dependent dehydrogenase (short-subunit alcohol dehydrogenase family)